MATEKELAAWLISKKYAVYPDDALRYVRELREGNCPDDMVRGLTKNLDLMMELGGSVTAEKLLPFLTEKLKSADKLIAYWKDNPKDTNAVFFLRTYSQIKWEEFGIE